MDIIDSDFESILNEIDPSGKLTFSFRFGSKKKPIARGSIDTTADVIISNGIEQYKALSKRVRVPLQKASMRAISRLTNNAMVIRSQLDVLEKQIKERDNEFKDIVRLLNECQVGKDHNGKTLTAKTKRILIASAVDQVNQVMNEDAQISAIIKETSRENENAITESISIQDNGAKEAIKEMNNVVHDQSDIVEIKENMENRKEIPTVITNIPDAPPAPKSFLTPRVYNAPDGEKIKISPLSATSADAVEDAILKDQTNLRSVLFAQIRSRRKSIEGGGDIGRAIRQSIKQNEEFINERIYAINSRVSATMKKHNVNVNEKLGIVEHEKNSSYKLPVPSFTTTMDATKSKTNTKNVSSITRNRCVDNKNDDNVSIEDMAW